VRRRSRSYEPHLAGLGLALERHLGGQTLDQRDGIRDAAAQAQLADDHGEVAGREPVEPLEPLRGRNR